jgi:Bacterial PH domain
VRVVRARRLGMPSSYLEVDARDDDGTERLLVMGRMELGTDPHDVAEALQHHRARAGRGGASPEQPSGHPARDPSRDSARDEAAQDRLAVDDAEGEVADGDRGEHDDHQDPGDDEPRRHP